MTTFAQWLKARKDGEDDAVGQFARFWESVTPGKISTPQGVQRHIDKIRTSAANDPGTSAAAAKALEALPLVIAEYHRDNSAENAERSAATLAAMTRVPDPVPDPAGDLPNEPGTRPAPVPPGEPQSAADRLKARIAANAAAAQPQPPEPPGDASADYAVPALKPDVHGHPAAPPSLASLSARIDAVAGMTADNQRALEKIYDILSASYTVSLQLHTILNDEFGAIDWAALYETSQGSAS